MNMKSDKIAIDPVCLMKVEKDRAHATTLYGGMTYYFCSLLCKDRFDKEFDKNGFIVKMKQAELGL